VESLILKCKEGDEKAQFRLYRKYSGLLYNAVIRLVASEADAEDVLQESFIKAFRNIHKLENPKALAGWLKRIAINEALSFLRKHKVRFQTLEVIDSIAEEEVDWTSVSMETIHHKIKELPEGCRVVFTLFLLEDYGHKEIAGVLNISESTSKTQYKRAKQLLQQSLRMHYERG
jgi:RNA polymerase sigma-70 factor (ECF subfamily)